MTRLLADRYELAEVVGAGGVARVHRAVDHHLERDVAVKVLDDEQARSADPSGRDRFLREARSAARLHHPHLVTIYDAGEDAGELFLVMELVDGQSLAQLIARCAPLPIGQAVDFTIQILDGLSAVHAEGLIHRDVKPANILVDGHDRVRLTDFGIAKRLDEIEENLTSSGMVIGTPTYLAPEQAVGGRLSVSTDIYLVGLVLYEMLTGARPGGSALDPRHVRADVPAGVARVVARATDVDPRRRFGSAEEMIAALQAEPARVATTAFPAVAPTIAMPARRAVAEAPATAVAPVEVGPVASRPTMSGWWLLAGVATVLALIVGLLMIADGSPQEPDPSPLSSAAASTAPAAPVSTAPATTAIATVPTVAPSTQPVQQPKAGRGHAKKKGHGDQDG